MKAAEGHGARAGFCCRSGAGGTAAVEAATGAAVEAATGAAVEAATGAAAKVTAAAVCCGSVRGATEVAVVNGAWAECSGSDCLLASNVEVSAAIDRRLSDKHCCSWRGNRRCQ